MLKKYHDLIIFLTVLTGISGAFLIRFAGTKYGLHLYLHPDENLFVEISRNMVLLGELHPIHFSYPTFYYYIQAILYHIVSLVCQYYNLVESFYTTDISIFYSSGRILTAALSSITILFIYKTSRFFSDVQTSIIVVFLVAFSILHISHSIFITVDAPVTFLIAASFYTIVLIYKKGETKHYYISGILIGLAIGTKYTAILLLVPFVLTHIISEVSLRNVFNHKMIIGLLLIPLFFLITTPYLILDFDSFLRGIMFESNHYRAGHLGQEYKLLSYIYYAEVFYNKVGVPIIILAMMPLLSYKKHKEALIILYSFPITYFLFMGAYRAHFERNMLPMVPFIYLLAGIGIQDVFKIILSFKWVIKFNSVKALIKIILVSAVGVLIFVYFINSINYIQKIRLPDTRYFSKNWIEKNITLGSYILREPYTPYLNNNLFEVTDTTYLGNISPIFSDYQYVVISELSYRRFKDKPSDTVYVSLRKNILLKEFTALKDSSIGPKIQIYKIVNSKK